MIKKIITAIMAAGLCLFAGSVYAGASAKMASEVYEPMDPKKKKPGDECKAAEECQRHHSCTKQGDKSVCTAPPRPKMPPGVVT